MKNLLIIAGLLLSCYAGAQTGKSFPEIETEKISGKHVQMPAELKGGYALVGIGMGKKAEDALRTWQTPVYNKFIAKTGLMDDMFDVKVVFLPVFTGASRAAKGKIVQKLKENNESLVIDHVYIYSGNSQPFDDIAVDDRSEPYFLLLDPNGKIIFAVKGDFRQKYLDQIDEILMKS